MSEPAQSRAALDLFERKRDDILREWVRGIAELPDFAATALAEIEGNASRCFTVFMSRLRGDGDEALREFAEVLAQRRFQTGFDIHAPIDAAGRFRRGVEWLISHSTSEDRIGDPSNLRKIAEQQCDAFNRHFSIAFSTLLVRASERRVRELFDNASDVFLRFDGLGTLIDTNLTFERLLGRKRSEWIGRNWLDLVVPSDREAANQALQQVWAGQSITSQPLMFAQPVGEPLRLLLSGHRADSGPERTMIAILRDVSSEETLRAQVVQAEKLASIGQLAASVAHELNNPLTWVSGNLIEALDQLEPQNDPIKEMLEDSLLGAERMATIVSDLRTYSHVDDQISEFIMSDVVDMAIRIAGNQLNHRARVERRYGPMPPFVGHAGRLSQVFVNLFVNAAQALASRRAQDNRLTISIEYDGDAFVIEVKDNGPGIPQNLIANIFQPFVSTKGSQGTGLGLWVCKNIIEEHRGTIDVRSDNSGTTFTISLPPRRAPVEAPRPSQSASRVSAPGLVLIVDDEEILLRVLARRLGTRHEVITARSGIEALDRLERFDGEVDVVLCDLGMPAMSGQEFYRQLKARWPETASRVRFMSGAPEGSPDGHRGTDLPRCYRKPVEIPELLDKVDEIVAKRRAQR